MEISKFFKDRIIEQINISNDNGYVSTISENLIDGIDEKLFEDDFQKGSGNELKSKFKALYSSSALVVNNFAIIKNLKDSFSFLGETNFEQVNFERKFPTGLGGTHPNLDFALENSNKLIAFESKYLETLDKKKVSFKDSYNKEKLNYINPFWFDLIKEYQGEKLFLDVAQLIKHSIGLINYKNKNIDKEITLVYIYWTPQNVNQIPEFEIHHIELLEFEERIKNQKDINFISMSYIEFWKLYENDNNLNEHFKKVRERYFIKI